jgi:tetratricopeptide (TPR) repeat protein
LPLAQEALKLAQLVFARDDPDALDSMNTLARAYRDAGKLEQAVPLWEEALKLAKARFGPDDPNTRAVVDYLADAYDRSGKAAQALPLWQERVKLTNARLGPDNLDTLRWTYHLAETLATLGKFTEAEVLFRDALERLRPTSSAASLREVPLLGVILHHLALVLWDQKKLSDARPFAEDAIILYRRHADWPLRERRHALDILDDILKGLGDMPALSAMRPERVEILRASAEKNDGDALNILSWVLATSTDAALRDGPKAVRYAEQAIKLQGKNWAVVDTLAAAYAEAGDFAKAADAQREAIHGCPDEKSKKDLEARLRLYESNSPFHE